MPFGKSDLEYSNCLKGCYINKQTGLSLFHPSRMGHQSGKGLYASQLIGQWQMPPRCAQIPNKLLGISRPIIPFFPANEWP